MTLRQKHKIMRKVKEHARKKRKDENKAKAAGIKPKKIKDPGLPSQWPYKEELVKEFAFMRAQALAEDKRKKEERKSSAQVCGSSRRTADGRRAGHCLGCRLMMRFMHAQTFAFGQKGACSGRVRPCRRAGRGVHVLVGHGPSLQGTNAAAYMRPGNCAACGCCWPGLHRLPVSTIIPRGS